MADKRSFEEQVRDELAGFSLAPEAFVWDNVESSLQKDNKRRWIIWFFLLAVAGSAAAFWMYDQFKVPSTTGTKQVAVVNTLQGNNNEKTLIEKLPGNQPFHVEEKIIPAASGEVDGETENNKIISKKTNLHPQQPTPLAEPAVINPGESAVVSKDNRVVPPSPAVLTDPEINKEAGEQKPPAVSIVDTAAATVVTDKKTVTAKKIKPWKLSAILDLGQSGAWYKSIYAGGLVNAAAPPSAIVVPSVYSDPASRSAFSFGAGIDAEKAIGKKWDLGISLAYQYYASKINVGTKVNTVLGFQNSFNNSFALTTSGYYLGSADETYINTYHLFETGISFYRNFKLSNSFSIRWQSGIAGAWLFSSNALHYNQTQNILYKDNSLLHRFQLNLSTGLEAGIGKAQRIFVGPQFTYFPTTSSEQTSQYDYRHLVRVGLRTHVLLSKNKSKK